VLWAEGVGALSGIAYLKANDPRGPRTWVPVCPTKVLTRLDCPGCGGLRLVHDLLEGNTRAAVHDNLFMLACSPVLVYLLACHWGALLSGRQFVVPRRMANGLLALAVLWTIVRNLPKWPLKPAAHR